MLEICNSFAAEHNYLIFNTKKNHLGLSMETQFVLVKKIIYGETKLDGSPVYVIWVITSILNYLT